MTIQNSKPFSNAVFQIVNLAEQCNYMQNLLIFDRESFARIHLQLIIYDYVYDVISVFSNQAFIKEFDSIFFQLNICLLQFTMIELCICKVAI